jgi:hypothetical protein
LILVSQQRRENVEEWSGGLVELRMFGRKAAGRLLEEELDTTV